MLWVQLLVPATVAGIAGGVTAVVERVPRRKAAAPPAADAADPLSAYLGEIARLERDARDPIRVGRPRRRSLAVLGLASGLLLGAYACEQLGGAGSALTMTLAAATGVIACLFVV